MFQADTLADLAELIGFIHWLGYACVGLVLSLVATTTVMSVQDRIKEHAVLQTLGFRPLRVFRLVVTESTLLSTIGGGLGVWSACCFWHGRMSVAAEGVTIAFRPSLDIALQGSGRIARGGTAGGTGTSMAGSQNGNCSRIAPRMIS